MFSQWTSDWEKCFQDGDVPWEEELPSTGMQLLFSEYVSPGARVLEVGCGYGTNAAWLAQNGYIVDAIDLSPTAIEVANRRFDHISKTRLHFLTVDFCKETIPGDYDAIFDKGVFHSFKTVRSHRQFAERVYRTLKPGGYWINISGSTDNPDPAGSRETLGLPRVSMDDLHTASKDLFEIHEIRKSQFGIKNDFLTWEVVFKKPFN